MDGMDAETEYVTPGGDVGGSTSTVDPREAWDDMSIVFPLTRVTSPWSPRWSLQDVKRHYTVEMV